MVGSADGGIWSSNQGVGGPHAPAALTGDPPAGGGDWYGFADMSWGGGSEYGSYGIGGYAGIERCASSTGGGRSYGFVECTRLANDAVVGSGWFE